MSKLKQCPHCAIMHEKGVYHDYRCCNDKQLEELKTKNMTEYHKYRMRRS